MLFTPVNHFNWMTTNFSNNYPTAWSSSTQLAASATPHVKGSDTAVLNGIAEDCYGMSLLVGMGATTSTVRRQMIDILIDPDAGVGNAGASWSVLINNVLCNSPWIGSGLPGHMFYFPIYLKAGTAIGARVQDVVGSATIRLAMKIVGKPTHPELVKVGTQVQTIGAVTASTDGVALTPGTATWGSYSASMGTLTRDAWWWQIGVGSADTTMTGNRYDFDIAHDATSKYTCASCITYGVPTVNEQSWKTAYGDILPILVAPAGTDVYVRSAADGAPDTGFTAVVYAVS